MPGNSRFSEPSWLPRLTSTDLMMLGVIMIWGVNFSVIKSALRTFSPLAFNALRFSVATVVMLVFFFVRSRRAAGGLAEERRLFAVDRRDLPAIALLGLGGHTLYQVIFATGMSRTMAANASLLMATSPIFVAVLGHLLHVERAGKLAWAGIGLSFVGILTLIGGGKGFGLGAATLQGDLMILTCAVLWAVYTTGSKPYLARYSPLKLTILGMLAGTPPLVVLSIPQLVRQDWRAVAPGAWAGLAFSAFLAVALCYVLWYTSVQRVGNARTAIFSNLTPVIGVLTSWVALGDRLSPLQLMGAVVVLCGIMVTRRGRALAR